MDKAMDNERMEFMAALGDMAYEIGLHLNEDVSMEARVFVVGQKVVSLITDIAHHATEDDLYMMLQLIDALEERVKNYE